MEHAQAFEPIHDGRIYIEKINRPFIDADGATPAEYKAGCGAVFSWRVLLPTRSIQQ